MYVICLAQHLMQSQNLTNDVLFSYTIITVVFLSSNLVLEKTLETPLDCKEIQPVHSEGDQPWDFFGRNDAKAETPVLWPPDAKSWLFGKDSDAGRDWEQEEKGMTEDEMGRWHHWLNGNESEWTPGVGDGQGGLPCCDSWGRRESDTTATELNIYTSQQRVHCLMHIEANTMALAFEKRLLKNWLTRRQKSRLKSISMVTSYRWII